MPALFYDHLVLREELDVELNKYDISPEELEELRDLIDQILHHHTLNLILSYLPREHHAEFIRQLHAAPYADTLLVFLNQHISVNIESAIRTQAQKIKQDLLRDIHKHSRRH